MTKYIFITGGVVSSLGKGITTASVGALLKICGYNKLRFLKLDPYLNVDPGTMDPFEHGEVYVTEDGQETDLDLGHYERFTEIPTNANSNITSGKLYLDLLTKERHGDYLGKTVQIVPHLTDDIKNFIEKDNQNYDFVLCEVGGTVGDIEANPMIEAIRQFRRERPGDTISIHVTLIPMIKVAGELKTKPTQHSVKQLMEHGIIPDIIVCRTSHSLSDNIREKIALYSNLTVERIIEGIDMDTIYKIPLYYAKQNMIDIILNLTGLPRFGLKDLSIIESRKNKWTNLCQNINNTNKQDNQLIVAIIGKYIPYDDAYKSLVESINHASWALQKKVVINWVNARDLTKDEIIDQIDESDCVIIPGGFGKEGINNKISAIQYCRVNSVPILGICLGMQLMVIEFMQNVLSKDAVSTEWLSSEDRNNPEIMNKYDIGVGFIEEWKTDTGELEKRQDGCNLGGTMRLGSFQTVMKEDSLLWKTYMNNQYYEHNGTDNIIYERHRHRYEVNKYIIPELESYGMIVSGISPDGNLPEVVEIPDHTYFIGCQYHPEFKSTPFTPRPLFLSLFNCITSL